MFAGGKVLPPDDSGTQAREGMKEREGDEKKREREAGGKQGAAKSQIKRATPPLASVQSVTHLATVSQLMTVPDFQVEE